MTIFDVLGINEADGTPDDVIKKCYDTLIADPQPQDIQVLSEFLCDPDPAQRQSKHWGYCLDAIEAILKKTKAAKKPFPLSVQLLERLSMTLLNDDQAAVHNRGCELLASAVYRNKRLSDSILRTLENILETGSESLCAVAAATLSRAFKNDQELASNIIQLVESAFNRHTRDRLELGWFLNALLKKIKISDKPLVLATYETLCQIILADDEDRRIQNCCYNILSCSSDNAHEIPGVVFEALAIAIEHQHEPTKEKAFYMLMTCLASERNKQNIAPDDLAKITASLKRVLGETNLKINKYAVCILGSLVTSFSLPTTSLSSRAREGSPEGRLSANAGDPSSQTPRDDVTLEAPTSESAVDDVGLQESSDDKQAVPLHHADQILLRDVLVDDLIDILKNEDDINLHPYAVSSLHCILSQGRALLLLSDELAAVGVVIKDPGNNLELRKKAIGLMGLSARNNDPFSHNEFKVLVSVLQEKNAALSSCCLKAVLCHLKNHLSLNKLDHDVMQHVMHALNNKDTFMDAINIFNRLFDGAEDHAKSIILGKFLAVAGKKEFQRLVQSFEDCRIEAMTLLILSQEYHPNEVKRIQYALNEPLDEETPDGENASETSRDALTIEQLVDELRVVNKDSPEILNLFKDDSYSLQSKLHAIDDTSKDKSILLPFLNKIIIEWDDNDCLAWARALKADPVKANDPAFLTEIIAVMSQGSFLATEHRPRLTQLFSLLLLLDAKGNGRLAQIATGEGKSTIVAMLAAIKALQGQTVDVVSSSPLLAFRDAEASRGFFELFGLSVASNWEPTFNNTKKSGPKACYQAQCSDPEDKGPYKPLNIVYGDANNFQFDLLRDEYKQENTRCGRPYGMVIVDEVDSMLIDELNKTAELGTNKPLMDSLEILFIGASATLREISTALDRGEISLPINEETGQASTKMAYLKSIIEDYLIDKITDPNDEKLVYIPKHLKEFALSQAPYWARSAVIAHEKFVEGVDYRVVGEGDQKTIAPVDFMNTGVTHSNSVWGDGLHQFLQAKHEVRFSSENLTASFISNMKFFNRYEQCYGLTGTIGDPKTQELLKKSIKLIWCLSQHSKNHCLMKLLDFCQKPMRPGLKAWLLA